MESIAVHLKAEPGKFSTDPAHIHDRKRSFIERGASGSWTVAACWATRSGMSARAAGPAFFEYTRSNRRNWHQCLKYTVVLLVRLQLSSLKLRI